MNLLAKKYNNHELPFSVEEIVRETKKKHKVLSKVAEYTRYEWPDWIREGILKSYWRRRNEASLKNDCITCENRISITNNSTRNSL